MVAPTAHQNVLLVIHGVLSSNAYVPQQPGAVDLWDKLCAAKPALAGKIPIANHCYAQWGQDVPGSSPVEPDQELRLAESFLYSKSAVETAPNGGRLRSIDVGSVLSPALRHITDPLKDQFGLYGLTDVFYYCSEGEAHIRRSVYSQLLPFVQRQLAKEMPVRLHVIGHSLGTVIAHDVLFGIFRSSSGGDIYTTAYYKTSDAPGMKKLQAQQAKEIVDAFSVLRKAAQSGQLTLGSFVTAGSPVALMSTRSQALVDSFFAGKQIDPAGLGLDRPGTVLWKNFYDRDDVIAYALAGLYDHKGMIEDWEVNTSWNPLQSHLGYWHNEGVLQEAAALIDSRS